MRTLILARCFAILRRLQDGRSNPTDKPDGLKRALAYSQMGLQMALTVGLGLWGGMWADRRWACGPWGLLGGLFLGGGVGLTVFILDALRLSRLTEADDKAGKETEPK